MHSRPPSGAAAANRPAYDPATYWNAKARRSGGDAARAVTVDDPVERRCIRRVQRRVVARALKRAEIRVEGEGARVLDYGCGTGQWVRFFEKRGFAYSGVDVSSEMIALARRQHPKADVAPLRRGQIPHANESFDMVASIAVVHHNDYSDQKRIVAELARVLRPGGALLLFEAVGPRDPKVAFLFPRGRAGWIDLAKTYGLTPAAACGGAYCVGRLVLDAALRRMPRVKPSTAALLRRVVARLDSWIDPWLAPLLPERLHTRLALVFRK